MTPTERYKAIKEKLKLELSPGIHTIKTECEIYF